MSESDPGPSRPASQRKRKRRAAASDADTPVVDNGAGAGNEVDGEEPPRARRRSSKNQNKTKKLHPANSRLSRAIIDKAHKLDPHALHVLDYNNCDPAEIAACRDCQKRRGVESKIARIRTEVLVKHGVKTRVDALRRPGAGGGATPPVPGPSPHPAVAWRVSALGKKKRGKRARPLPSALGPNRDKEKEARALVEARKEAKGRGEAMRREMRRARSGSVAGTGGDGDGDSNLAAVDEGGPTPDVRSLDDDGAPADFAEDPATDPDRGNESGLLEPVDAEHDTDSDAAQAASDLMNAEPATTEDAGMDVDPNDDDGESGERISRELDDLDQDERVAEDYEAVAHAYLEQVRARSENAQAERTDDALTVSERNALSWRTRKRDARLATALMNHMSVKAAKKQAAQVNLRSILKRTSGGDRPAGEPSNGESSTAGASSVPFPPPSGQLPNGDSGEPSSSSSLQHDQPERRKSVHWSETAQVWDPEPYTPPMREMDWPHPYVVDAIHQFASEFYANQGALQEPFRAKRSRPYQSKKRAELEKAGVWKEPEDEEEDKERRPTGPYIRRNMYERFDSSALLWLCNLFESLVAEQLRLNGWKTLEEFEAEGWHVRMPPGGVEPWKRPQRVYLAGEEVPSRASRRSRSEDDEVPDPDYDPDRPRVVRFEVPERPKKSTSKSKMTWRTERWTKLTPSKQRTPPLQSCRAGSRAALGASPEPSSSAACDPSNGKSAAKTVHWGKAVVRLIPARKEKRAITVSASPEPSTRESGRGGSVDSAEAEGVIPTIDLTADDDEAVPRLATAGSPAGAQLVDKAAPQLASQSSPPPSEPPQGSSQAASTEALPTASQHLTQETQASQDS